MGSVGQIEEEVVANRLVKMQKCSDRGLKKSSLVF
jgi:hypothetical protein